MDKKEENIINDNKINNNKDDSGLKNYMKKEEETSINNNEDSNNNKDDNNNNNINEDNNNKDDSNNNVRFYVHVIKPPKGYKDISFVITCEDNKNMNSVIDEYIIKHCISEWEDLDIKLYEINCYLKDTLKKRLTRNITLNDINSFNNGSDMYVEFKQIHNNDDDELNGEDIIKIVKTMIAKRSYRNARLELEKKIIAKTDMFSKQCIVDAHLLCVQMLCLNEMYEKAEKKCEKIKKLLTKFEPNIESQCLYWYWYGQALFFQSKGRKALELFKNLSKKWSRVDKLMKNELHIDLLDIFVWICRCKCIIKNAKLRQEGIQALERLVNKNNTHVSGLTYLAVLANQLGKSIEAIPYSLRAFVMCLEKKPVDLILLKVIKRLFGELLSLPKGMDMLITTLIDGKVLNATSLRLISKHIKDVGKLEICCDLLKRALKVDNNIHDNTKLQTYLSLIHAQEALYLFNNAFNFIKEALYNNIDETIGCIKIADIYNVIKNIKKLGDDQLKNGSSPLCPAYEEPQVLFDAGVCMVKTTNTYNLVLRSKNKLSDNQLDLLAIIFTAIKLLFVNGALQPIPKLINIIELERKNHQLAETLIRNEHSYYVFIAQLMREIVFPIPKYKAIIYMCGDSHCLSSAWHVIKVNNKPTLLKPKLVTGMKCWHMRTTTNYYPRRNFQSALTSIPTGNKVIMIFGEIDCREGVIVGLERDRYDNINHAIDHVVKIYKETVHDIIKQKRFRVQIHPVPQVLDVTRPIVTRFNVALDINHDVMRFPVLKFANELLSKTGVKDEFQLDGTHLSPKYLSVLQLYVQK